MELASLLARNARHAPDAIALQGEERTSWRQLHEQVQAASAFLRSYGVEPGERVVTVVGNREAYLVLFWACVNAGAVFVPLSPLLMASTLRKILLDCAPRLVVFDPALAPAVHELALACGAPTLALPRGARAPWNEAAREASPVTARLAGAAPCNIVYSSGTTGDPKGIVHSRFARAMYAQAFAQPLGIDATSVVLHAGSLVFNGAFISMLPTFMSGATFCFLESATPDDVIERARTCAATHLVMVPSLLALLLADEGFHAGKLPAVKRIVSMGAPLPVQHKARLRELFPGCVGEMYGLTEGIATVHEPDAPQHTLASVGRPPPFFELEVVDARGRPLPPRCTGEIVGTSPILMTGYIGRPQATAATLREGRIHSGDLGYLDEQGYLYIVGRSKEMLISGGVNVYPRDIEEVASAHPQVLEAAVFGVPHEKWGETPVAALLLRPDADAQGDSLRGWINARVGAKYQRIADAWVVPELPRNTAGKVVKDQLRQRYLQARPSKPGGRE